QPLSKSRIDRGAGEARLFPARARAVGSARWRLPCALQFSSLIELLLDRRDDVEVDGDGWPPQALSRRHVLGFFRCFIGTSPSGILDSSVSPQRIAPMSRAF